MKSFDKNIEAAHQEQYLTQLALNELGINSEISPSQIDHVGNILMNPESMETLRTPYAVEVLGMPQAGKTTLMNRYLNELWLSNERHLVHFIPEGVSEIKNEYGNLRNSDPFLYSMLGGASTFLKYLDSLQYINRGMRMIMAEHGQIDRRVFRRVAFSNGHVRPEVILNEEEFIHGAENTPVQIGGIIMLMVRPEVSLSRAKREGPVNNMDFLPKLYNQYWRLYWEILQGKVPYRLFTCIDAEGDPEEIYQRFKYAMDTSLNLHSIYADALAKAFLEEYDRIIKEKASQHKPTSLPFKIVGGDDLVSEEDVWKKSFYEILRFKK